ncbi:hypothetical protein BJX64DRAFT_262137 [Aspergillus heterothallicus]
MTSLSFSIHSSTTSILSECQQLLKDVADFYAPYEPLAHKIALVASNTSIGYVREYYRSWHTLNTSLPSKAMRGASNAIRDCRSVLEVLQAMLALFRKIVGASKVDSTAQPTNLKSEVELPLQLPFCPEIVEFLVESLAILQGHLRVTSADWQMYVSCIIAPISFPEFLAEMWRTSQTH